ncbi:DUF4492 domain-containing protein [Helicobacter sp. 12S02232-10]|uniref:DUF4492 domain-containing protein n=1 Tax=Helicobacter sp. 12S02232-10 TaxID=1476197 RepID=UPI000BA6F303|nr:DUF4492 domain-containing protein [Helicobacter sp. 12S02232-10]PAF49158.1 DUF4492 domain-containing protein [Helicobacter sp. 12S02232-10]
MLRLHYFFKRVFLFYIEGFKKMETGKTLWKIIIIKLIIMFGILKIFLFDKNIDNTFNTNEQKSSFVLENLTK